MENKVQQLHRMWIGGERVAVVEDIAYMNQKPGLLAALGLIIRLDRPEQLNLIRRLRVKFAAFVAAILFATCLPQATRAEEREAPPSAHFLLAGTFAVLSVVHYDRAVKYQERAEEALATGSSKAPAFKSRAQRMRFRSTLLGAAAGCFLLSGSVRLVLDDGIVGVRKEVRF